MPNTAVRGFSARRAQRIREERGLSREVVAATSGLSFYSVAAYEEGWRTPRRYSLDRLAGALGCKPEELLDKKRQRR